MPGINTPGSAYLGQYDAGGAVAYTLDAAGATCAVSGGDADLIYTPFVPPMSGGWALGTMYPGQYYNQNNQTYTFTAAGATVAVTGGSATLTYTQGQPSTDVAVGPLLPRHRRVAQKRYTLLARAGHLTCIGGDACLRVSYRLTADPILVPVTLGDWRLSLGVRLDADGPRLRTTTAAAQVPVHRVVASLPGRMALSGGVARVRYDEAVGVPVVTVSDDPDPIDLAWMELQEDEEALCLLGIFDR